MVSIMSIGAGSVGDSARPALPTTMSTSGNRQRTMSRAFRSSAASTPEARGTLIGMSMTIPSSSGVMNSRPSGFIRPAASATRIRPAQASTLPRQLRDGEAAGRQREEERRPEQPGAADRRQPDDERRPEDPDQRRGAVEQRRRGPAGRRR